MTVNEIVDVYLKHKGMRKVGGDDGLALLLPLLIMDAAYQLYDKYIKQVESHREMKNLKSKWLNCYHNFNMEYFRAFNPEQTDFVVEMMDSFGDYISHDINIAFIQSTNLFNSFDFEKQKVLAAGILIDILCQCAQIIHDDVFPRSIPDINIKGCKNFIKKWTDLYYGKGSPYVNPNESKELCLAVDVLCKKQVKFLREYERV